MILGSGGRCYCKKKRKEKKDVRNFGQNFCLGCLSAFSSVFRSIKIKTHMNFYSEFTSIVDPLSGCNNVQNAMGLGQKHRYNHGRFGCTWLTISFFTKEN